MDMNAVETAYTEYRSYNISTQLYLLSTFNTTSGTKVLYREG